MGEIGELRGWTYTKINRCINEGRAELRRSRRDLAGEGPRVRLNATQVRSRQQKLKLGTNAGR
jgi:hypothetical protein